MMGRGYPAMSRHATIAKIPEYFPKQSANMIAIEVKIFMNTVKLEAPDGATVRWILDHLHVQDVRILASINNVMVGMDHVLKNGDRIRLLAMAGGG